MPVDWKSLPSFSSLRAFEAMSHSKSFAEAARSLNVTQAAIAQHVRKLELDLGMSLAKRTGRSVELTREGRQLAKELSIGFETIAESVNVFRVCQRERPIQMAATVFIAQSLVLPRLHEFWATNPTIEISVLPTLNPIDIIEMGFDLAIRATETEPNWPNVDAEFLIESEIIAVGSAELVNDQMPPLEELPWIWSRDVDYEERTLTSFGMDPKKLRNVDIGAPLLQLQLARRGLGICFATELVVREDLACGRLLRLPIPSQLSVRYYVVTPKGPVRPTAACFISWLSGITHQMELAPQSAEPEGGDGGQFIQSIARRGRS